jgi:hypothetical protein
MGRIEVLGQLWEVAFNSIPQKTGAKWTGGMTQAAECLLCMSEALSSNSSLTKNQASKQTKRH